MKHFLSISGGIAFCVLEMLVPLSAGEMPQTEEIHSSGNPILSDGSAYSAEPAPVVAGDTLYILAGRDIAPEGVNRFVMPGWQLFATRNVASGNWTYRPDFLEPQKLFKWAAPDNARGSHILRAPNGKFYLFASVMRAGCQDRDCYGIGVAVADAVTGPWKDAHPGGPLISESAPEPNAIRNIDPAPFEDASGRVWLYWGSAGQLRVTELAGDMVRQKGKVKIVPAPRGFSGAPWLFQRKGTYYLAYAANNAGPKSECTPTLYHACIAYASAESPVGPWTYRGVILPPVSSASSHAGIIKFKDRWFITYHTAGAKGGGHFRRAVAIDPVKWDDTVTPARILPVTPTPLPPAELGPQRNVAPGAQRFVSNAPVPVQYWAKALNDGIVRVNPLPPDMWGTWQGDNNPAQSWVAYLWDQPQTLDEARIFFWNDHPAGSSIGIAPPASWHLEYCQGKDWLPVQGAGEYPVATHKFVSVNFAPVHTRCLRAVFHASGQAGKYAAVAVEEFQALATRPVKVVVRHQSSDAGYP